MNYRLGHKICIDRPMTEARPNPSIVARICLLGRFDVIRLLTREDEIMIACELRDSLDDHIRDTSIDEEDGDDDP